MVDLGTLLGMDSIYQIGIYKLKSNGLKKHYERLDKVGWKRRLFVAK